MRGGATNSSPNKLSFAGLTNATTGNRTQVAPTTVNRTQVAPTTGPTANTNAGANPPVKSGVLSYLSSWIPWSSSKPTANLKPATGGGRRRRKTKRVKFRRRKSVRR